MNLGVYRRNPSLVLTEGEGLFTLQMLRIFGLTLALSIASASVSNRASAQVTASGLDSVGKGTVGLGLIGAELGFAIPALIGVEEIWPYIVFPTVGAVGGAVGG